MRSGLAMNLGSRIALALIVWAAVLTSSIRSPITATKTPNYLRRNFATCPVSRFRALTQFDTMSRYRTMMPLARGNPRPETHRSQSAGPAYPLQELSSLDYPHSQDQSPMDLPLRC
jgi:hypothetical protein